MSEEEAQIEEEYKVWKKNSPFLYDVVMTHSLEWPSLTVQWLPGVRSDESDEYEVHSMLLGTHTSKNEGELQENENELQNYLMIAETKLPSPNAVIEAREYNEQTPNIGGFGAVREKVRVVCRMAHDGEVNKARYNPGNSNLIATKSPSGNVYLFDRTKHTDSMQIDGHLKFKPDMTLSGHTKEGFGLCWSPHGSSGNVSGHILSGSDDNVVCLWDISQGVKNGKSLDPLMKLKSHSDVVEDVSWSYKQAHLFASCSDDKSIILWDSRDGKQLHSVKNAHKGDINCVNFNPHDENLFITGGSDKVVNLWDIRKFSTPVHGLEQGHNDSIVGVQWSPHEENIVASSGRDRRLILWDLARIGEEQTDEEAEDGPPELLFSHGGHTDTISDFSWNAENDDYLIASVSEDNMLQIYSIDSAIFNDEDGDGVDVEALLGDSDDEGESGDTKRQKTGNSDVEGA
jgi:histone-binding protein RBBP4